jgi:large subunit ribosomal protein L24e
MDCTFCGKKIEAGTGLIHVNPTGKALNFCSSKCKKNMLKLGRKPRKVKWTQDYREEKEIRIRGQTQPTQEKKEKKDVKAEAASEEKKKKVKKEK